MRATLLLRVEQEVEQGALPEPGYQESPVISLKNTRGRGERGEEERGEEKRGGRRRERGGGGPLSLTLSG